jgi:hypothetical protein
MTSWQEASAKIARSLRAQTSKPDRSAKTDALERFLRRIPSIRWEKNDFARGAREPRYFRFKVSVLY